MKRESTGINRRALLGGVCASPLLRHPGLDPGPMNTVGAGPDEAVFMDPGLRRDDGEGQDDGEWDEALDRFNQAQAVLDSAVHEEDEDAYDRLLDSHSEALVALLALPAPGLPALAAKLDVIVPQLAWELSGCEDCLETLRHDAHRLAATHA
jgi:hypothetical protein